MSKLTWPWHWDERPHGWFTANGMTKFGPLPQREPSKEPTWPPRTLERAATMDEARQHFGAIIDDLKVKA